MDALVNIEPKKVRINLWVPSASYQFLLSVADRDGRPMSDVVREAIRDYMIKDKQTMGDSKKSEE